MDKWGLVTYPLGRVSRPRGTSCLLLNLVLVVPVLNLANLSTVELSGRKLAHIHSARAAQARGIS